MIDPITKYLLEQQGESLSPQKQRQADKMYKQLLKMKKEIENIRKKLQPFIKGIKRNCFDGNWHSEECQKFKAAHKKEEALVDKVEVMVEKKYIPMYYKLQKLVCISPSTYECSDLLSKKYPGLTL